MTRIVVMGVVGLCCTLGALAQAVDPGGGGTADANRSARDFSGRSEL
jgi:hypothetical protein